MPRFWEADFQRNGEETGNDHPETRGRVLADRRRRRGRPAWFTPEIGAALSDLVINDDVPIKHAARRLGLGLRTVYDWLERAQGEGPPARWPRKKPFSSLADLAAVAPSGRAGLPITPKASRRAAKLRDSVRPAIDQVLAGQHKPPGSRQDSRS